jgi:hypothetical protein
MVCKVWYICNLYQKLLYISRVFALKKYKPLKDMVFYSYIVFYIRRIIRFVFAYKQWVRKKNLLKVRSLTRDFFPKKKKKKNWCWSGFEPGTLSLWVLLASTEPRSPKEFLTNLCKVIVQENSGNTIFLHQMSLLFTDNFVFDKN